MCYIYNVCTCTCTQVSCLLRCPTSVCLNLGGCNCNCKATSQVVVKREKANLKGILQNLDCGPWTGLWTELCWASPCIYSFSPCARMVLYVDLTAKLALPCQLVHRPFDLFNTRVHFWAWLCSMTMTSHKSPHGSLRLSLRAWVRGYSLVCCPARESRLSVWS